MMNSSPTSSLLRSDGSALRVYTDIPQVEEFLTRAEFIISMFLHSTLIMILLFFPTSTCF